MLENQAGVCAPSIFNPVRRAEPAQELRRVESAGRCFHPLPTLQTDKVAWVRSLCGLLQQPA